MSLRTFHHAFVQSYIYYELCLCINATESKKRKIVENMNKVMRKLQYEKYDSLTETLYRELNIILILKNKKFAAL